MPPRGIHQFLGEVLKDGLLGYFRVISLNALELSVLVPWQGASLTRFYLEN